MPSLKAIQEPNRSITSSYHDRAKDKTGEQIMHEDEYGPDPAADSRVDVGSHPDEEVDPEQGEQKRRWATAVKREDEKAWNWAWAGISVSDTRKGAMEGVAISVAGYDEELMSTGEILRQFYEDGWRARLYELKLDEDGDTLDTELKELL